jgi:geranylgeranyl diphosphate synthase type II
VTLELSAERAAVDRRLDEICEKYLTRLTSQNVADAAAYGLRSPGKRLRPLLVQLAYRACGGAGDASLLGCGPEVIHAYSLVHDDLPCMDDDDVRRGQPTVHRVYGSRAALLAGAALIPLAAVVVRKGARELGCSPDQMRRAVQTLAAAAGARGMIGGQLSDLAGEASPLTLAERERIHAAKTGALIVASLAIGAIAADATDIQIDAFRSFGRALGLAFQIMDDVLDVVSTTSVLGKTTGRDEAMGKSTHPAILGVPAARERAEALVRAAADALAEHRLLTHELSEVANFIVTRTS